MLKEIWYIWTFYELIELKRIKSHLKEIFKENPKGIKRVKL